MKQRLHFFAVKHDYIKLFVITYVALSAIIAIFLGLFYFLLWILIHFILELYKRYHMFGKLNLEDFLIALQHCRIDLMFFFVGVAIETIAHHSFAIAAGRAGSILRLEKETLLLRELRLIESLKSLPRILGTIKASKSVAHIAKEIVSHKIPEERERFHIEKADIIIIAIIIGSFAFSTLFLLSHGMSFEEIVYEYLKVGFTLK